jgi:hypothetical protein
LGEGLRDTDCNNGFPFFLLLILVLLSCCFFLDLDPGSAYGLVCFLALALAMAMARVFGCLGVWVFGCLDVWMFWVVVGWVSVIVHPSAVDRVRLRLWALGIGH